MDKRGQLLHRGGATPLENGVDAAVADLVMQVQLEFPWVDPTVIESHMLFFRTHAVLQQALAEHYTQFGLNVARFNLLRILYHAKGQELPMGEIGNRLRVSGPTVTKLVDGLERDGWVRRGTPPHNRRTTYVTFAKRGRAEFPAVLETALGIWHQRWACLSQEERRELNRLIAKLRRSLMTEQAMPQEDGLEY